MAAAKILQRFTAIPNEDGLIEGFQNDGHSLPECFAELIDNAIDAKADRIKIKQINSQVSPNSKKTQISRLIIGDNGTGVVGYKLTQALTIGDRHPGVKKIGRYGFGLKTAGFNLGNSLIILTKTKAGELEAYQWDREDTSRSDFDFFQIEITSEFQRIFNSITKDTGTVIIIDNIHPEVSRKLTNPQAHHRVNLLTDLGTIFHKNLEKQQIQIEIDNRTLKPRSLFDQVDKTLVNKTLSCAPQIRIKFHHLDEIEPSESSRGIYVYLRDRLLNLAPIQDADFKFHHATFNHLRLEIIIPSWEAVNEALGLKINNQKNGLHLSGPIKDEISEIIYPFIKEIREKVNAQAPQLQVVPTVEDFSEDSGPTLSGSNLNNSWRELSKFLPMKEGTIISAKEQKQLLENKTAANYIKEPRLLNKFDSSAKLPAILKKKKLAPMPISNKEVMLVSTDTAYLKITPLKKSKAVNFNLAQQGQPALKTLSLGDITSEKKALNFCLYHGILNQALDEKNLIRTVEGMERTNKLNIQLGKKTMVFDGVQIETDAGYEGAALHLIEAKMISGSEMTDIHLRQVILPHAHYCQKMYPSKMEVKSWLFLWYSEKHIVRLIPVKINTVSGEYELLTKEEKVYQLTNE